MALAAESVSEPTVQAERFIEAPTGEIVAIVRVSGRGRASGIAINRQQAHVWRFEGERARRDDHSRQSRRSTASAWPGRVAARLTGRPRSIERGARQTTTGGSHGRASILVAAAALFIVGAAASASASSRGERIQLRKTGVGTILVNGRSHTMYISQ